MSTTRAERPRKPAPIRRANSPILRPHINAIPTVKSLVANTDALSKQDTYDFARGHLSHLPGAEQNEEVTKALGSTVKQEEINWPRSRRSRNNLPKLTASLNIVGGRREGEISVPARRFVPDEKITQKEVSEALKHHTDYPSVKGLTHGETKRHFDRQQHERNKKLSLQVPNLSQNFDSQEPGQYLYYTNQAMSRIADQNQIFGQVLQQVHKTYNDYIAQLHKAEAKTNQKFTPGTTPDHQTTIPDQHENLEEMAKHAHQLELDALGIVQKISEVNAEISIEKNRVRDEKDHFDKYKFLHHERPIYKAVPTLPVNMDDVTKAERINSDLHDVVALVSQFKELESDIRARKDDKKSILKADFNRTKLEFDDLELDVGRQEERLAELEEERKGLEKSCLFFLGTLNNAEMQAEYEQLVGT